MTAHSKIKPLAGDTPPCPTPSPAGARDGEPGTLSLDEAADEGWEDDLLPLSSPVMQRAMADWNAKYGKRT